MFINKTNKNISTTTFKDCMYCLLPIWWIQTETLSPFSETYLDLMSFTSVDLLLFIKHATKSTGSALHCQYECICEEKVSVLEWRLYRVILRTEYNVFGGSKIEKGSEGIFIVWRIKGDGSHFGTHKSHLIYLSNFFLSYS